MTALEGPILVTGGAGFVGASLAVAFKRKYPALEVIALDNLKRRGSELNLNRLKAHGVRFVHGDVRNREDLAFDDQRFAVVLECSAEPSVLAGVGESPIYLLDSNLVGALNCLELARKHRARFVFISTSRVYPHLAINGLRYIEEESRFTLAPQQPLPGASAKGISEVFPLDGPRTLYGATKLSAELIALEYAETYGIETIINRCGVIAGPWQMGKVDQGVITQWMAAHFFKKELRYIGFNGQGKQVRDVLHVDDLFALLDLQLRNSKPFDRKVFNVGGGLQHSLSLLEMTALCREISGNTITVHSEKQARPGDIRSYISDCSRLQSFIDWQPQKTPRRVLSDIWEWIHDNEALLHHIFG